MCVRNSLAMVCLFLSFVQQHKESQEGGVLVLMNSRKYDILILFLFNVSRCPVNCCQPCNGKTLNGQDIRRKIPVFLLTIFEIWFF